MIVIDTSAPIAVPNKEPHQPGCAAAMHDADKCFVSSLTVHGASVAMPGKPGPAGVEDRRSPLVMIDAGIDGVIATAAYVEYGKGRGNEADFNICDCAVYGLAKSRGVPLPCKGGDFARTDMTTHRTSS